MMSVIGAIFGMAAPLLFATLGALCTEYAGVLAVFMDGAITFAGFVCIAVTGATGSPLAGFMAAALATVTLLYAVAKFTEYTRANPFVTGLAVNLLVSGVTSWLSAAWYGTRGVLALSALNPAAFAAAPVAGFFPRALASPASLAAAILLALILRYTGFGLKLKITGTSSDVLTARGVSPGRYKILSWCIAAFFAACAGSILTLNLGAYVPNVSAGRGWTALAAVYLGFRNPLLCVGAVLLFASAEYATNVMQGFGNVPSTLILGLPYALALLVFIVIPRSRGR